MEFRAIPQESCIMMRGGILVFYYVDDTVFCYHKSIEGQALKAIEHLCSIYTMKSLGEIEWFLGIRVIRDRSKRLLWLSQEAYIDKMANKFDVQLDKKLPDTPMISTQYTVSENKASHQSIHLYQQRIGTALFAAITTRPDIAFTVSKLSQFSINPSDEHHQAAMRVLEYLYATKTLAIQYEGKQEERIQGFLCASDASFADNKDRKSSQGYIMTLFGGPVAWKASKQATVTTSSTEAELMALSDTTKEAIYLRRLLKAIKVRLEGPVIIDCDNKQTINLITSEDMKLQTRLRHVDIHKHWLSQEYQAGRVSIRWLATAKMPADGLTKALSRQKHEGFIRLIGLVNISERLVSIRKMESLKNRLMHSQSGVQVACFGGQSIKMRNIRDYTGLIPDL